MSLYNVWPASAKNQQDCYYFYNSTCMKGESCPFRHEPSAIRNVKACPLWVSKGFCPRPKCFLRHPSSTSGKGFPTGGPLAAGAVSDKSTQPCYWETQPSGCLRPGCTFKHFKLKNDSVSQPPKALTAVEKKLSATELQRLVAATSNNYDDLTAQYAPTEDDPDTLDDADVSLPKIAPIVVNNLSDESDSDDDIQLVDPPVPPTTESMDSDKRQRLLEKLRESQAKLAQKIDLLSTQSPDEAESSEEEDIEFEMVEESLVDPSVDHSRDPSVDQSRDPSSVDQSLSGDSTQVEVVDDGEPVSASRSNFWGVADSTVDVEKQRPVKRGNDTGIYVDMLDAVLVSHLSSKAKKRSVSPVNFEEIVREKEMLKSRLDEAMRSLEHQIVDQKYRGDRDGVRVKSLGEIQAEKRRLKGAVSRLQKKLDERKGLGIMARLKESGEIQDEPPEPVEEEVQQQVEEEPSRKRRRRNSASHQRKKHRSNVEVETVKTVEDAQIIIDENELRSLDDIMVAKGTDARLHGAKILPKSAGCLEDVKVKSLDELLLEKRSRKGVDLGVKGRLGSRGQRGASGSREKKKEHRGSGDHRGDREHRSGSREQQRGSGDREHRGGSREQRGESRSRENICGLKNTQNSDLVRREHNSELRSGENRREFGSGEHRRELGSRREPVLQSPPPTPRVSSDPDSNDSLPPPSEEDEFDVNDDEAIDDPMGEVPDSISGDPTQNKTPECDITEPEVIEPSRAVNDPEPCAVKEPVFPARNHPEPVVTRRRNRRRITVLPLPASPASGLAAGFKNWDEVAGQITRSTRVGSALAEAMEVDKVRVASVDKKQSERKLQVYNVGQSVPVSAASARRNEVERRVKTARPVPQIYIPPAARRAEMQRPEASQVGVRTFQFGRHESNASHRKVSVVGARGNTLDGTGSSILRVNPLESKLRSDEIARDNEIARSFSGVSPLKRESLRNQQPAAPYSVKSRLCLKRPSKPMSSTDRVPGYRDSGGVNTVSSTVDDVDMGNVASSSSPPAPPPLTIRGVSLEAKSRSCQRSRHSSVSSTFDLEASDTDDIDNDKVLQELDEFLND